jgi:segregation and condensation protein A
MELEDQTSNQKETLDLEKIIVYPTWREMLLDMIYEEKIDPWDIDIHKVTTTYINKIKQMQKLDLRIPANLVLAAAILLRIKAYRFLEYEQQTQLEDFTESIPYSELETIELKGRIPPKGRLTLEDLMNAIEEVIEYTKKREEKIKIQQQNIMPIIEIKLSEFKIDKEMERVYNKIKELADSYKLVSFNALLEQKTSKEIIYTFLPLLFLAQKGKITLIQEKIFEDIFISLNE